MANIKIREGTYFTIENLIGCWQIGNQYDTMIEAEAFIDRWKKEKQMNDGGFFSPEKVRIFKHHWVKMIGDDEVLIHETTEKYVTSGVIEV